MFNRMWGVALAALVIYEIALARSAGGWATPLGGAYYCLAIWIGGDAIARMLGGRWKFD